MKENNNLKSRIFYTYKEKRCKYALGNSERETTDYTDYTDYTD